jgi:hypothetical protein
MWMMAGMVIPGMLTTATSLTQSILGAQAADNFMQTVDNNPMVLYAGLAVAGLVAYGMLTKK